MTVTLSGAHTIGHVHASGYNGHPGADMNADPSVNAWDNTPTKFDNGYFVQLIGVVRLISLVASFRVFFYYTLLN